LPLGHGGREAGEAEQGSREEGSKMREVHNIRRTLRRAVYCVGLRRKGSILLTIILPAKGKEAWKNACGGTVLTAKMFIFTSVVGKMNAINRKMNHLVEKNG
jgi:hypothetical protein